jgi:outer membrane immunogenic protein
MKKLFVAGIAAAAFCGAPAFAADMPVKGPYAAPAPAFSWTGFYVGGEGGYGRGNSIDFSPVNGATSGTYGISGATGGGTAGYNWQLDPHWVVGLETDFSFANIHGSRTVGISFGCGNNCSTKVDDFGTVRGRIGFAQGNALFYGTGGWAYGRTKVGFANCTAPGTCGTNDVNGWTAGGGIEYALNRNWSAKIEYLRVNFGNFVYSNSGICAGFSCTSDAKFNVVRAGLNYRFGTQ